MFVSFGDRKKADLDEMICISTSFEGEFCFVVVW